MTFITAILRTIFEALFKNVINEVKKPVKAEDAPVSPDRDRFLERMRGFEGSLHRLPESDIPSGTKRKR